MKYKRIDASKMLDNKKAENMYMETMEESTDKVHKFKKTRSTKVQSLGICEYKKRLLESIQKPYCANNSWKSVSRRIRISKYNQEISINTLIL